MLLLRWAELLEAPRPFWAELEAGVAQLVKNLPAIQETWVRSLGLGRSPGEEKGYPLQYSGLENSMDCIVLWDRRVRHIFTMT